MPTELLFADASSNETLLASTAVASSFEVTQNNKSITPQTVIFYPEENSVRLMFSSDVASVNMPYSITENGLLTTDGGTASVSEKTGYLSNFNDSDAYAFSVISLCVCDAYGKSVSLAKADGAYTVKLVYANPENTEKTVTVKNGNGVLCTFRAEANTHKTLTKSLSFDKGEEFSLSFNVN